MGVLFGLVIGKPVGIFIVSRIMVASKIAHLPSNTSWKQILGMGTLAGIGFTMSIFTTMLAFSEEAYRDIARIAILLAVIASVFISLIYFRIVSGKFAVPAHLGVAQQEPQSQVTPQPGIKAA
jgi:NhaA family Na+:H+ antiporter